MSAKKETFFSVLVSGIWKNSPTIVLLLGMCPTLAITGSADKAVGMGMATMFVLVMSNVFVSLLRNIIPSKMRIPCFLVVIASFVTIVEMATQAYTPALYKALGIFIPLIVVNCIVLGRAEAFAYKKGVWLSVADGIGMGLGFTLGLLIMSVVRETLGNGSFYNISLFGPHYPPLLIMILPPGAFLTLGCLLAFVKYLNRRQSI